MLNDKPWFTTIPELDTAKWARCAKFLEFSGWLAGSGASKGKGRRI
jgi:hypothetical protein